MPSKEPRKQLPNGDKVATCFTVTVDHQYPVTVYQHPRTRLFAVEYGHELRTGLRYTEASDELGACLMHAIACSGTMREGA